MDDTRAAFTPFDEAARRAIEQRSYTITRVNERAGRPRQNLAGCTVSGVRFLEYKPGAYTCCFTIIKTKDGRFSMTDAHTSRVQRAWRGEDGLCIETRNTLYLLQETDPVEFEPARAVDLLELYLANGVFFAGFLYDGAGRAQPLTAYTHGGMFADSQLVCRQGESGAFECRYFVRLGNIRFYGREFLRRPLLLHNLGPHPLGICWEGFSAELAPGRQLRADPRPKAEKE